MGARFEVRSNLPVAPPPPPPGISPSLPPTPHPENPNRGRAPWHPTPGKGGKEAGKQGLYANPGVGARTPFVVVRPAEEAKDKQPPPFDPTPKDESSNSHGIRQSFGFEREGTKYRSLAYVFYRSLFGLKVRISVPEGEMSQADFEAEADRAARWLVPQIAVNNYGTCGQITINPDAKDAGEVMMQEVARVLWESCGSEKGPATPKGKSVEIVYPAGTWESH